MAVEVEVIKFEGDLSDLKKQLKTAESSFSTLENKGKVAAKNTEQSFNKLGNTVKGVLQNLPFGHLVDDLEAAGAAAQNLGGNVGSISNGANKAGTGVKALTGLIGVGLLGAITLVIAAGASLVAFFKSTDEGAAKLEATFAGVGAASDVLTGKLAETGSEISEFFTTTEGESISWSDMLIKSLKAINPVVGVLAEKIGDTGLAKAMGEAYDAGYALSLELDSIQDEMRLLGVESKQADLIIGALLKQTKNRSIDVQTRLAIVNQAQETENNNLKANFELQKRYYDNLTQQNILAVANRNTGKAAQVDTLKAITAQIAQANTAEQLLDLYRQQIDAQKGLLSISDAQAQTQVDALQKIIELAGRSEILSEKYAAIQAQLIEKDIAERTEAIKAVERTREAAAISTIKGEKELSKEVLSIKINSLQAQRSLLVQYGKDVSQIDLEIAQLNKKYLDDLVKSQEDANAKRLASDKARSDAERKLAEENYKKSIEDIDENTKFQLLHIRDQNKSIDQIKQEELKLEIGALENKKILNQEAGKSTIDIELEIQAKKKALYDQDVKEYSDAQAKKKATLIQALDYVFSQTESIYNGLAQNQQARTQAELSDSQKSSQAKQAQLQQQLESGVISQEKYSAQLKAIQQKQAAYENQLKAKQAKADKDTALFNILINTAASVVKTLAQYGFTPAGLVAAGLAGLAGAAQYTITNARPVPKYKDGVIDLKGKGTGTSDSIDAKLSKGESVMTAKETSDNLGLLWAVRNNKLDDYINRAWVLPALNKADELKQQKDQRYNKMMKRVGKKTEFDTSDLERAVKRNGSVKISNWHEMPKQGGRNFV